MNKKIMEKVNEVGRFKQRAINYMYSSGHECFDLDLNLGSLRSYRFDYTINKESLQMFLDYIGYLVIPELGIEDCKVRVTRRIRKGKYSKYCNVYLTLNGKKKDVDNVNTVLKRLFTGLKE
jgi:hypothetical protein